MSNKIDCIVVGYNDIPVKGIIESVQYSRESSGAYRHFLANTLNINGERKKYATYLNDVIKQATGKDVDLYATKLPNLGACHLISYLEKRSFNAQLINSFNHDQERFIELLKQNPRSVAITTTFYVEATPVMEIVNLIRKYNKETKIIVGGPYIYNLCLNQPKKIQDYLFGQMNADIYVNSSQGEDTLSKICAELREPNPDFSGIPNLSYLEDTSQKHQWKNTPIVRESNDMDENIIDWSLFDKDFLYPTVQVRTARSCAFKCAFCAYPIFAGQLSLTGLSQFEKELDYLHSIGVKNLFFIDDTFNIPQGRFKDLCRMMIKNKYNFNWFSYFRCANADDEAIDLAARSGCTGVFLGIESGSSTVLKAMNKGVTVAKYMHGIKRLKSNGIITHGSFIIGHPGETEETVQETLEFINETQLTFYCLEIFFMNNHIPISKKRAEYGIEKAQYSWKHKGMDWERASELVEIGYRSIKNSIFLPNYSFDLWSVAYLMGEGLTLEQIKRFLATSSEILIKGLNKSEPIDHHPQERNLVALFKDTQLEKGAYSRMAQL
ncbi:MAG: radical SAM protein [bacterium]|nr:radical SAM protein [bacterium]